MNVLRQKDKVFPEAALIVLDAYLIVKLTVYFFKGED